MSDESPSHIKNTVAFDLSLLNLPLRGQRWLYKLNLRTNFPFKSLIIKKQRHQKTDSDYTFLMR